MRSSRRTLWALAASLALHLAVAALVWWWAPARSPLTPPPASPLEVTIVTLPAVPAEAPAPAAPVERVEPAKRPREVAGGPGRAAPESVGEGRPGAPGDGDGLRADPGAPPRLSTLEPSFDVLPAPGAPFVDPRDPRRGSTIRNDGSGPTKEQLAEMEALEAEHLIGNWMKDDLAGTRVARGLVDPWFQDMRKRLEQGAAKAPKEAWPGGGEIAKDLVDQYRAGAARYGASGNPYGAPKKSNALPDQLSPLARGMERDDGLRELQQRYHAAATLRDFADGEFAGGLVALVEIRQAKDGQLLDVKIVRTSGNAHFDAYVIESAPDSIAGLGPIPPGVAAAHADGIRSLWAFQGALTYKRKLREFDVKNAGDAAYLAAVGFAGLLTGNFEETTGDVEVVDLRNPRFKCKVKLLRLY